MHFLKGYLAKVVYIITNNSNNMDFLVKQTRSGANYDATYGLKALPGGSLHARSFSNRLDYVNYRKKRPSRPQERRASQLHPDRYFSTSNTRRHIDFSSQFHMRVRAVHHVQEFNL
jgi:hypothetical protein